MLAKLSKAYPVEMQRLLNGIGEDLELCVSANRYSFKFTDLPAEIRHIVYTHLLCSTLPIQISRRKIAGGKSAQKDAGTAAKRLGHTLVGQIIDPDRTYNQFRSLSEFIGLSILRVSKLLNVEASKVLYAMNSFIFVGSPALSDMQIRTGNNFSMLRDIEIAPPKGGHYILPRLDPIGALKSPTRIVIHEVFALRRGSETNSPKTLKSISGPIWKDIRSYITGDSRPLSDRTVPHDAFIKPPLNCPEHRHRMSILHFMLPLDRSILRNHLDDKIVVRTEGQGDKIFKEVLLRRWREDINCEKLYRDRDKDPALNQLVGGNSA